MVQDLVKSKIVLRNLFGKNDLVPEINVEMMDELFEFFRKLFAVAEVLVRPKASISDGGIF